MSYRILITGSEGLIGRPLRAALEASGVEVVGLDLLARDSERGDVRDVETVRAAVAGCAGVIHLAAVSRVVWAEHDPDVCWSTNVDGLRNIIAAAEAEAESPWVLFTSSREVHGQPDRLPAYEDTPLRPINTYGRSKAEGERVVLAARERGLKTAVVRLSNVYGATSDHADRVVPAFARAAACGGELRVDGPDRIFDFTHVDDVRRGLLSLVQLLVGAGPVSPPVILLTGSPVTLGELARLAVQLGRSGSSIREAAARSYDVSHFYGSPARAARLLGWTPRVELAEGLGRLVHDFKRELGVGQQAGVAS